MIVKTSSRCYLIFLFVDNCNLYLYHTKWVANTIEKVLLPENVIRASMLSRKFQSCWPPHRCGISICLFIPNKIPDMIEIINHLYCSYYSMFYCAVLEALKLCMFKGVKESQREAPLFSLSQSHLYMTYLSLARTFDVASMSIKTNKRFPNTILHLTLIR